MKNIKILGALTVAGVVAMTGSAFTAGITIKETQQLGAATQTIQGGTASSILYELSPDGQTVETVRVTFVGDLRTNTVQSAFNGATRTSCVQSAYEAPASLGGSPEEWSSAATEFMCSGIATESANSFSLLVTDQVDAQVS